MPDDNRSRSRRGGQPPRRRGRARSPYASTPTQPALTSHPTTRTAYAETRRRLLAQHGPVCAYCGETYHPDRITLDHVTPRRGQSAYDRHDNLVLACQPCNGAKADKPIVAFLLARRERAALLLRYGSHLSPMLVELARQLAGPDAAPPAKSDDWGWDDDWDDGESPYKD